MENKKKTVITVETWRRTVLRRNRRETRWCELCGAEVEMLSPAQAAQLSKTSQRAIFRRLEAGCLHFAETPEGGVLICGNSLS